MAASSDFNVQMLPIRDVFVVGNRRSINDGAVSSLAESIGRIGLRTPITVRIQDDVEDPETGEILGSAYAVVVGAHRLEAFKKLGLTEIPAIVRECSEIDAELWEIDENLVRADLSPSQRATLIARRKEIYEGLHPETRHGAVGRNHVQSRKPCDSEPDRFTSDTAAKTGRSERAVQLDAERGEKIAENVMVMVAGTALDNGAYLDKLKKLSHDAQWKKAESDLRDIEERKRRSLSSRPALAADPLSDGEAVEKQVAKLMAAWNAASPEAREVFLARVDRPVFDNTRAGRAA